MEAIASALLQIKAKEGSTADGPDDAQSKAEAWIFHVFLEGSGPGNARGSAAHYYILRIVGSDLRADPFPVETGDGY